MYLRGNIVRLDFLPEMKIILKVKDDELGEC